MYRGRLCRVGLCRLLLPRWVKLVLLCIARSLWIDRLKSLLVIGFLRRHLTIGAHGLGSLLRRRCGRLASPLIARC